MNHSCNPNCRMITVTRNHADDYLYDLAFFAFKDVPPMTELTFDYNPGWEKVKKVDPNAVPCLCGESNCRGQLWPNQRKAKRGWFFSFNSFSLCGFSFDVHFVDFILWYDIICHCMGVRVKLMNCMSVFLEEVGYMRSSFLYGSWHLSWVLALHCIIYVFSWETVQKPRCLSKLLHVNFFVSISDTPVDSITSSFFFFFPLYFLFATLWRFRVHRWL